MDDATLGDVVRIGAIDVNTKMGTATVVKLIDQFKNISYKALVYLTESKHKLTELTETNNWIYLQLTSLISSLNSNNYNYNYK